MSDRPFYLKWKEGRVSRSAIATAPNMNAATECVSDWLRVQDRKTKAITCYAVDVDLTANAKSISGEGHARALTTTSKPRIYVASKSQHGATWRSMRDLGYPICSTWIDESEAGQTEDWSELWRRCLSESTTADALILYAEDGESLVGAFVEVGAALSTGKPVLYVGPENVARNLLRHPNVRRVGSLDEAFAAACVVDAPVLTGEALDDSREMHAAKQDARAVVGHHLASPQAAEAIADTLIGVAGSGTHSLLPLPEVSDEDVFQMRALVWQQKPGSFEYAFYARIVLVLEAVAERQRAGNG